jgi:hypothetical protein
LYCKYCGQEFIAGKRFCVQCGKPAEVVPPMQKASEGEGGDILPGASEAINPGRCDICDGPSKVRVFDYFAYAVTNRSESRMTGTNMMMKSWTESDFKPLSLKCCDECILGRIQKGPKEVPADWQNYFSEEIKKMVLANGRTDWCTKERYRLKEIEERLKDLKENGTPGAWTVEDSVRYYAIVEKRLDKCVAYGAQAVGPIIELAGLPIESNQFNIMFGAADALGKIGAPSVEPLIKALEDENALRRAVAARALGRIGDPRAVKPLEKTLEDKDKEVRTQTKKALKKLQGK